MKAAFNTHTDYVTLLKYSKGKEGEKEKSQMSKCSSWDPLYEPRTKSHLEAAVT